MEQNSPPQRCSRNPRHWQSNNVLREMNDKLLGNVRNGDCHALFTRRLQNLPMRKQTHFLHLLFPVLRHWRKKQRCAKVLCNFRIGDLHDLFTSSLKTFEKNLANDTLNSPPQRSAAKSETLAQQQVRQTALTILELGLSRSVHNSFQRFSCRTNMPLPRSHMRRNAELAPAMQDFPRRPVILGPSLLPASKRQHGSTARGHIRSWLEILGTSILCLWHGDFHVLFLGLL